MASSPHLTNIPEAVRIAASTDPSIDPGLKQQAIDYLNKVRELCEETWQVSLGQTTVRLRKRREACFAYLDADVDRIVWLCTYKGLELLELRRRDVMAKRSSERI